MILARAGELLFVGLTKENVRRMEAGQPVRINEETHPAVMTFEGPVTRLVIFLGDDERHCYELLKEAGTIDDETKVIALPKGGHHGRKPS